MGYPKHIQLDGVTYEVRDEAHEDVMRASVGVYVPVNATEAPPEPDPVPEPEAPAELPAELPAEPEPVIEEVAPEPPPAPKKKPAVKRKGKAY